MVAVAPRERRGLWKRLSASPLASDVLFFFLGVMIFMALGAILGPTRYIILNNHHELVVQKQQLPGPKKKPSVRNAAAASEETPLPVEADIDELDHEADFLKTITQCLPKEDPKKCKTFIPEPLSKDQKTVQRVAVVAPPGDVTMSLQAEVDELMQRHNQLQKKIDLDIEVIETSHVPPYGYGKTHGLTKVIRLIPQPIVLEVTDALLSLLKQHESHDVVTLADLKGGLRQILRFHCRISHLSAHTALLSVDLMELLTAPQDLAKRLKEFLIPNDVPDPEHHLNDDLLAQIADDDQNGVYEARATYGTQLLSHVQQTTGVNVLKELDQVFVEEMKRSKNLTIWPCPSFWAAGDEPDPTVMSPLLQRLAQALSPDCNDPHAKCGVKRDRCEAKGDSVCK